MQKEDEWKILQEANWHLKNQVTAYQNEIKIMKEEINRLN